ncbi:hypothetical protein [Aliiglaciecola litoralis]|uniref:Uncharacterized protein n=1 Tax=Aliiglaciecola litoralis TaxID=582857 RepID=A0ABN1LPY7_9ALTE
MVTTITAIIIASSIIMALNGKELLCLVVIVALFSIPQLLILVVITSAIYTFLRK